MSHRALIAVPVEGDGASDEQVYDVYKSQNGGEYFRLYDVLNDYRESLFERLQSIPTRLPQELDRDEYREQWVAAGADDGTHLESTDSSMIDETPYVTSVELDAVIDRLDYILYEVLYVVREDGVDTYFLNWFCPLLQDILRNNGTVRAYRPDSGMPPSQAPLYQFTGDDFFNLEDAERIQQRAPPISQVAHSLIDIHRGFFQNIRNLQGQVPEGRRGDTYILAEYLFELELESNPEKLIEKFASSGVLIPCDLDGIDNDLVWDDIRNRANHLRWNHSQDHVDALVEADQGGTFPEKMGRCAQDFIDKNRIELGEEVRASGQLQAFAADATDSTQD